MRIYRAETGQKVNWESPKLESVDELKRELEKKIGVPMDNQILMTSYGTSVNEDNVQEVIESTGKNEYIVFCYDRQYLEANPEQISTLLDVETPKLESKPATFDGNISLKALQKLLGKQSATQTCDAYLTLFGNFDAYSQSLMKIITHHMQLARQIVEEQKLQSMAINVAMTNLETHNKKKQQCIQPFITNAERELNRQNNLLSSVHNDIEILRHIHVHPDIMSIMDTDKVSLLDYIDLHYIETVRKDTLLISDYLSSEINELRAMSASLDQSEKELQAHVEDNNDLHSLDTLLIDIQEIQQKAQFLRDKIKRDLHRIYGKISGLLNIPLSSLSSSSIQSVTMETSNAQSKKLFETFNHLADIHIKDYMPKLFKYEITIRQRVTELTNSKRRSIQIFTEHMNEVSTIQNDIASVPPRIEKAEDALLQFKQKYGLNDLVIVRDILFSYGALMIELVRRKEYTHLLRNNADLLSDLMSTYRNEEEKRREYFRHKIMRSLPFKLKIADTPSSQCEINTRHTTEPITITMQKQDIIDFISLLRQVYSPVPSPINRPSYSVFNAKPLESSNKSVLSSRMFGKLGDQEENKFLGLLDTMLKDLNNLKLDFLKTMETTFFINNGITVAKAKPKEEKDLNDQIKKYEARIASLEYALQHQSRMNSNEAAKRDIISANSSSTFSTVIDTQLEELKAKYVYAEKRISVLEKEKENQDIEIDQLQDLITKLEEEHSVLDNEKEDAKLQIIELEQLLEEERQTYEHNRLSLLNEAKIKDNLADIRIASAEDDLKVKIDELQQSIEKEKELRMKEKMEYQLEIDTLKSQHQSEIDKYKSEIDTLRAQLQPLYGSKADSIDQLKEENKQLQDEKNELNEILDQLKESMSTLKEETTGMQIEMEEKIQLLEYNLGENERIKQELKSQLLHTCNQMNRAQEEWATKNEELERIRSQQESIRMAISDLLYRYMGEGLLLTDNTDLGPIIKLFQRNLDSFTVKSNMAQESLETAREEYADIYQQYVHLQERHNEWQIIASQMADKLEDYRKNVLYRIINQLQLPLEEDEVTALSKKVTPSEDETALWNEILQLSSSNTIQKLTVRLNKKVKETYEYARQYKKHYKDIKEKIAFRNFKVGDVALFTPTKNRSGPWAAFNVGSPYYFLEFTNTVLGEIENKAWLMARITSIREIKVDAQHPETNRYGLKEGLTYYLLETEDWRNYRLNKKRSRKAEEMDICEDKKYTDSGLASIPHDLSPTHTSPTTPNRPPFSSSTSSNNIVHSYASSSIHHTLERRSSLGFMNQ